MLPFGHWKAVVKLAKRIRASICIKEARRDSISAIAKSNDDWPQKDVLTAIFILSNQTIILRKDNFEIYSRAW